MSKKTSPYLTNKFLLEEVKKSKKTPKVNGRAQPTEKLSKSFMLLVDKYSNHSSFRGYTFREDMEGEALITLCNKWWMFSEDKSNNPFAYYTQLVKNSFIAVIKKHKKQYNIRDEMLTYKGVLGSYSHQDTNGYNTFWRSESASPSECISIPV